MYNVEHRVLQKQLAEYIQTQSSRILKHALSTKIPENGPTASATTGGHVENRVLKNTGDAKTQANTGVGRIDPNFENHVCHENPGKRPTASAKTGVKSKIVF